MLQKKSFFREGIFTTPWLNMERIYTQKIELNLTPALSDTDILLLKFNIILKFSK